MRPGSAAVGGSLPSRATSADEVRTQADQDMQAGDERPLGNGLTECQSPAPLSTEAAGSAKGQNRVSTSSSCEAGKFDVAGCTSAELDCPICLAALRRPCRTPCGHRFCLSCILPVVRSAKSRASSRCPVCRGRISVYSIVDADSGAHFVSPELQSFVGQRYIQGRTLGLASYHFDSEENAYISYSSPECSRFPPMDDGSRPPERKAFVDTRFDVAKREFRGVIDWSPNSWGGQALWDYRMVFSEDLEEIIEGELLAHGPPEAGGGRGPQLDTKRFGEHLLYRRWLPPPSTIYGEVFAQQATLGFASYHFESADRCYIDYSSDVCDHFPHLDDGRRVPATVDFVEMSYDPAERVFRGTINWAPTTWMGQARWDYRMQFTEDFGAISGGSVALFPPARSGEVQPSRTLTFGPHPSQLHYVRLTRSELGRFPPHVQQLMSEACDAGPGA